MKLTEIYISDFEKLLRSATDVDELKDSSVFVTGATGLIGSALVDFLIFLNEYKNFNIKISIGIRDFGKASKCFGTAVSKEYFSMVSVDVTKHIELLGNYDYIIYAASPANPFCYVHQPVETMLANLIGVNSLLEYACKHRIKKFLYISSSEVYGEKDSASPYQEQDYGYVDILGHRACYPSSKRAAETLCVAYANEYLANVSIVRPGHIYGPTASQNDTRASTQFFYDVLCGNDIVMKSKGEQIRSYCYVCDCVSAIIAVLIKGENKQAYNISNKDSICSIYELACCIAKYSGKNVVFEKASEIESKGYNPMSNSSLNSELIEKLGWQGCFDLETGVNHTLQIMKSIAQ